MKIYRKCIEKTYKINENYINIYVSEQMYTYTNTYIRI